MTDAVLPCVKRSRKAVPKKIKTAIFDRDGFQCRYCGTALSHDLAPHPLAPGFMVAKGVWPTIDHDIPLSRNGTNEFSNLVSACAGCNSQKGSMTGSEYRSWLADRSA